MAGPGPGDCLAAKWKGPCDSWWANAWIVPACLGEERAEALLHLRCIELNGDWDEFIVWVYQRYQDQLRDRQVVQIRTDEPMELPRAA